MAKFHSIKNGQIKDCTIYADNQLNARKSLGMSGYVTTKQTAKLGANTFWGESVNKSYVDAINNRPKSSLQTVKASIGYHGDHDCGDYSRFLGSVKLPKFSMPFNVKIQGKITMEWYGGGGGCRIVVIGTDKEYTTQSNIDYGHVYDFDENRMGEAYKIKSIDSNRPKTGDEAALKNKLVQLNTSVIPTTGKTDVIIDIDAPVTQNAAKKGDQFVAFFLLGSGWGSAGGGSDYGGGGNFDCTVHASTLYMNTYFGSKLGRVSNFLFQRPGEGERYFLNSTFMPDEYDITGTLLTGEDWYNTGNCGNCNNLSGRDCDCQGEGYELRTCYELSLTFGGIIKNLPIKYISKSGATVIIELLKLKYDKTKNTYTHDFGTMWTLDEVKAVYPKANIVGENLIRSCKIVERKQETPKDCDCNCNESNCNQFDEGYDPTTDYDCYGDQDCDQDCDQC